MPGRGKDLDFRAPARRYRRVDPDDPGCLGIEREHQASDERRYFVPCPHCGAMQWLRFERLRWDKGRPESAAYRCEACEQPIVERHKTETLPVCSWRPTATAFDPLTVGYHLSALDAPLGWLSWARIAALHEQARGAEESHRASSTRSWARPGRRGGEPDPQRLYERREDWPRATVPQGGCCWPAVPTSSATGPRCRSGPGAIPKRAAWSSIGCRRSSRACDRSGGTS